MAVQPYCLFRTLLEPSSSSLYKCHFQDWKWRACLSSQIIASDLYCISLGQHWPFGLSFQNPHGFVNKLQEFLTTDLTSGAWSEKVRTSEYCETISNTTRSVVVSLGIVFRDDPYFVSQVLGDEIFFFFQSFSKFFFQSAWRRSSIKVCGLPFLSFARTGKFS